MAQRIDNRTKRRDPAARGGVFTAFGLAAEAEPLAPGLYVVATPIGNLKDVSFRALSVLAASDAVLAEDTRVTKTLLAHYGITTPLVAYHEHSNEAVRERMLHRIREGQALALVSDAGTPLVSDPGYKLVQAAIAEGLPVTPIPGPSAILTALVVSGLPTHTFKTDEGDIALKCPTEIAITDRREKELDDLGFLSLVHCKGTDYAAFFGSASTNKPKKYDTNSANANSRLSAQLPYILSASRFAHYLKVIMRDKIGSFQSRADIDAFLNRWILQYVQLNDEAGQEIKAAQPLREARVDVTEIPGKPGSYRAVAFVRPHFQLNELTASIRLVAELPPPAA